MEEGDAQRFSWNDFPLVFGNPSCEVCSAGNKTGKRSLVFPPPEAMDFDLDMRAGRVLALRRKKRLA